MQIRTREKRKRRTFGMMSLGAAAVLALIMGVGIGVFATMSAFNPSALAPVVAEPTELAQQLSIRHNPGLFSIPREGDTPLYFEVEISGFGEESEYVRIAAPAGLGITDMEPVSLQGWTLSNQDGLIYTFGDESMRSSGIKIHAGYGYEHYGNVYIGQTESIWRLGDRLILRDANDEVLLQAAVRDILPSGITAYDNTVMIYSEALYTDMFDPGILTHLPIYVDVINPGTDDEHIRIENWLNVQDFNLSGWTVSSDTGVSYTLPDVEWYQPLGSGPHINIYTLPKATTTGKYHIGLPEPVWQSANTLTLTRPDGLSGTLSINGDADTPQSPLYDPEYIRPVYRYNDASGVFMVVVDGQPTAIFQLQVVNTGDRDREYVKIFTPDNVSAANVPMLSLQDWTLSDDDGNVFVFDSAYLPTTGSSLWIYTRDGIEKTDEVYMDRDNAIWDMDDTLTLTNSLGDIVLQANIGTLTYTPQSSQALSNSIYFQDPDMAPTGWMPPFMLNVDVIFPGQEGENVRISQQYGGEMPELAGWTISDDDGNSYRIPYYESDDTSSYLSLYTESGTDEPGKYYMGFDAPIWQLDDSLTITRPSDGATYNIIVEDSIESPWHLGNPPAQEDLDDLPCTVRLTGINLNLRQEPDTRGFVITPLQPDAIVTVLQARSRWDDYENMYIVWYNVSTPNDEIGWVRADMTEPVDECVNNLPKNIIQPDLRSMQVMGSSGFMGHYGEFTFFGEGQPNYAYDLRIVPSTDAATEHIQINFATQYPTSDIPPISIDGWTIERDGQTIYRFDNVDLTREGLKIYTGFGIQSDIELYMEESSTIWSLEDTFILKDVTGREIISQPVYNLLVDAYVPGEDIQSMRSFYRLNADLKATPVSEGCTVKPITQDVEFGDGPYENRLVIRTLDPDEMLTVLQIARDLSQSDMWWYQVRTDADEIGWVRQEGMEPVTDCPE